MVWGHDPELPNVRAVRIAAEGAAVPDAARAEIRGTLWGRRT